MSSGIQHQAFGVTESEHTCPHPWLPKTGGVAVAKHRQTLDFLRHNFCPVTAAAAGVNLADFWLIAHTGVVYMQSTRIPWGEWLKYSLWTLLDSPSSGEFCSVLLSHHTCRHRSLGFDGLSSAPLRSTKFNPKHPVSRVKKILITVTIFLKKKKTNKTSPKPKITMYTRANRSFSEKKNKNKNEQACKKKKIIPLRITLWTVIHSARKIQ